MSLTMLDQYNLMSLEVGKKVIKDAFYVSC